MFQTADHLLAVLGKEDFCQVIDIRQIDANGPFQARVDNIGIRRRRYDAEYSVVLTTGTAVVQSEPRRYC